ncbi:hypothetical protein [Streptomyces subrutilus]|uniref:hypothetical protein n=1 Tax=Streptomyces subrutilus TaxID=36818 RepID=UPI0033EE1BB1
MPEEENPCRLLDGPARNYCEGKPYSPGPGGEASAGLMQGASNSVRDLADYLIDKITDLLAPKTSWAPEAADSWLYSQFMWLGQHLAVAILICVVVVCGLTAWQGAPRLRQLGYSTGWTLAAVVGMASVPGVVMLLNRSVSAALEAMLDSNETTLFEVIRQDMATGADSGNPLAILFIISALVVALAFATLVFMCRNLGILLFVCMAPLVLASLARGGDMGPVKKWAGRVLGLICAPFALILITPFVAMVQGALVMDAVLLVLADALMLRMIFHGVPYVGPRIAGAARGFVEQRTSNPLAHAVVRAGAPAYYEEESTPRQPRTLPTPGRAMQQDAGLLGGAYGIRPKQRSGRLTTDSAIDKVRREAPRNQRLIEERRQARAAAANGSSSNRGPASGPRPSGPDPAAGPLPMGGGRPPGAVPIPAPTPNPNRGAPPPPRTP